MFRSIGIPQHPALAGSRNTLDRIIRKRDKQNPSLNSEFGILYHKFARYHGVENLAGKFESIKGGIL